MRMIFCHDSWRNFAYSSMISNSLGVFSCAWPELGGRGTQVQGWTRLGVHVHNIGVGTWDMDCQLVTLKLATAWAPIDLKTSSGFLPRQGFLYERTHQFHLQNCFPGNPTYQYYSPLAHWWCHQSSYCFSLTLTHWLLQLSLRWSPSVLVQQTSESPKQCSPSCSPSTSACSHHPNTQTSSLVACQSPNFL